MPVGEVVAISIAVTGAVIALLGTRAERTKNITQAAVALIEPLTEKQRHDADRIEALEAEIQGFERMCQENQARISKLVECLERHGVNPLDCSDVP